jgi:radical SAM protein with 4Fe4S-binding SPASM domain
MSDATLAKLMDEFARFTVPFYFAPFKVNEPFLDKRTLPLCEEFNRRVPQGALRLFTNGSALTDSNIEGVAKLSNVAHLWVSLNEIEAAAYEATMGLNFAHTAKRLDRLHAAIVEGQFAHRVVVSMVGGSGQDRADFASYIRDRWPRFDPAIIKRDAWIDFTQPDELEVPATPCTRWWELNIAADGNVVTCCMDNGEKPEYHLGNVNTQTMREIYNSPRALARRASNDRKQLDDSSPCARCSY